MKKIISFLILCNLFLFSPVAIADSVKQIFEQAMTEFSQGNYKKAIPLYEKALDMYPELAPAYNYLALAQKETGVSPSQVIATLQKAIEVNPNYATAYDNLCKVYYGVNDFDNAEKSCMRAVEIDPEAYSSKLALAWINLLGQSEPKEAITYFEDVVASTESEGGPQTQFGLGLAYFMVGEKFKTFEMITKLKMSGNEQMASQLEDMVRSNNYVPKAAEGLPLLNTPAQKKPASTLVRDDRSASSESVTSFADKSIGQMPVRVKANPNEPARYGSNEDALTGAEKIRQLQQNSLQQSKGSGY